MKLNTFKFLKRTFPDLNLDCIFIISKFLGKRINPDGGGAKVDKFRKVKVFQKRKEKYQKQIFMSFRKLSF